MIQEYEDLQPGDLAVLTCKFIKPLVHCITLTNLDGSLGEKFLYTDIAVVLGKGKDYPGHELEVLFRSKIFVVNKYALKKAC